MVNGDRKRNRSKVSPRSTGKHTKLKLDISSNDNPTCLETPEIRMACLGDIATRIAEHKDLNVTERDINLAKLIVSLIDESLTKNTEFLNDSLQTEITAHKETKRELTELQQKHNDLEYKCQTLSSQVAHINNRMLETEMNSMKNNVIISGVSETYGNDESNLRRWLYTLISKIGGSPDVVITAIHRIGRARNGRPRDIVVRFADYTIKREFFRQRFNIKKVAEYKDIFLAEQFPHEIQEQRKVLLAVATQARQLWPDLERKISVYQNVLFINNTRYKSSDLHLLPKELHSIVHGYKENDSTHVFFTKRSVLSNHYPCSFIYNNQAYNCGEQLFMAEKARCFGDLMALKNIMDTDSPVRQKAIGREIKGFNLSAWHAEVEEAIFPGLLCKFQQVDKAKEALLKTANRALGEATTESPWGTGKRLADIDALNQSMWTDENKIGKVLSKIRDILVSAR